MLQAKIIKKNSGIDIARNLQRTLGDRAAYVGIPASCSRQRRETLTAMAGKVTGTSKKSKAKKARLAKAAEQDVNNAELLFIHTRGSQARGIPARPVIEPAIESYENRQIINRELAGAVRAGMHGDAKGAERGLQRAAMAGQNAARKWFTNPDNHWAPNAPSTVRKKGSDQPLIDTGALRNAIIGIVK